MKFKLSKVIFSAGFAFLFSMAAFAAPSPGGKANIASSLPSGSAPTNPPMATARFTSNVQKPYPTNRWFGSIYTKNGYHNYSLKMSCGPLLVNYNNRMGNGTAYGQGFSIGFPSISSNLNTISASDILTLMVGGLINASESTPLYSDTSRLDNYSDWSFTQLCQHTSDASAYIKSTLGKGFIFAYAYFSSNVTPRIVPTYASMEFTQPDGTVVSSGTFTGDRVMVRAQASATSPYEYYAVYAPAGTTFNLRSNLLKAGFPASAVNESDRYLSIAFLNVYDSPNQAAAYNIFNDYYGYAYNFITDTKASYAFDSATGKVTTTFNFTLTPKRTDHPGYKSNETVFAVYQHQWKNMPLSTQYKNYTFTVLRGVMKVLTGNSFQTTAQFNGIIPNLTYEVPAASRNTMQTYINNDKSFNPVNAALDTYNTGKALSKAANLIPVFHQFGDYAGRNTMIERLKTQLQLWYTYGSQTSKYFGYDNSYGGLVGVPASYGSNNYADHNFHFGYYVYASAILALFDPDFATSGEYKGMVELLIKDFANNVRNDSDFPYLRSFDVYEGHSWANGAGGINNYGTDQESSAEAMNAWAGIYLWGLATGNQNYMALGAYGYATEYQAVKEYYLDTAEEIYKPYRDNGGYNHSSVGILWDNAAEYYVHWRSPYGSGTAYPQEIKGIQVLPLTPSMLYLGVDTNYAQKYYNEMIGESNSDQSVWRDIWARFVSMYNPSQALTMLSSVTTPEPGSSLTYSYQFINFFNALGKVNAEYYADNSAFCVMEKSVGGTKTFIAFNNSTSTYKTVNFKPVSGGPAVGSMELPPLTYGSTKLENFNNLKYDSLYPMYQTDSWYALAVSTYANAVTVSSASVPLQTIEYYKYLSPVISLDGNLIGKNTVVYIDCKDLEIPPGFSANDVKLYYYDYSYHLPDSVYPSQSINVRTAGPNAGLRITATITKPGTYLLAIPTSTMPPVPIVLRGTVKNAQTDANITAPITVFDRIAHSSYPAVYSDAGAYNIKFTYGQFTVTPKLPGFVFDPEQYYFNVSDTTPLDNAQNFKANPVYRVTGQLTLQSKPIEGISVYVYDAVAQSTAVAVSSNGGYYTANVVYGRNYVITPLSEEYDFSPVSRNISSVTGDIAAVNFNGNIAAGRFVVYPNPYKPSKQGQIGITFTGLKSGDKLQIYNIAGELVFDTKVQYDGTYLWDAGNNSGNQVASGVYIYYVSGSKTRKGKLAIER